MKLQLLIELAERLEKSAKEESSNIQIAKTEYAQGFHHGRCSAFVAAAKWLREKIGKLELAEARRARTP